LYRRPPTPNGLKVIEQDTLEWFSPEVYSNMNTGVLEEYIEERNRRRSFTHTKWSWKAVLFGMFIGTIFCVITEYVGLKVGIAIPGGGYIVYLLAILWRWKPSTVNDAQGVTAAATSIGSGFIFTFPALYMLHKHPDYRIGGTPDNPIFLITEIPPLYVVMVATIVAGMLGTVYFIIFRRLWLVEDPLPVPGFEAGIQLLEICHESWRGTAKGAMRTIKGITYAGMLSAGITFLRDMPIPGYNGQSAFDRWFGGDWYGHGAITIPPDYQTWTTMEFGLIPIQVGLGWYMRFRVAFLMSLGTLLTWFVIAPMSYYFETPIFIVGFDFVSVRDFPNPFAATTTPVFASYGNIGRIIAIGAILGGGLTALAKMYPVFKPAFKDVAKAMKSTSEKGAAGDYVPGKGWYEWPLSHIPYMMVITAVALIVIFIAGGYPFWQTIAFAGALVMTTFFLGAISVKVMGETGTQPVSGTSFITLILLVGIFKAMGTSDELTAVMAILCTTIFGSSISMSGVVIGEYKAALYVGNKPFHLMKAILTGVISGAIFAVIGAVMFSDGMATIDPDTGEPVLNLLAPQANAFASFLQALLGAASSTITQYIIFGVFLGIFAEMMTGMGTAFGLGMYFHLQLNLPMLVGGASRDIYEKKFLLPRAKRENWTERQTTLKVLDTFMMATGLIIGEAIMGVIVTIVLMFA
jgi:putative OPT family oligopeptide transporter